MGLRTAVSVTSNHPVEGVNVTNTRTHSCWVSKGPPPIFLIPNICIITESKIFRKPGVQTQDSLLIINYMALEALGRVVALDDFMLAKDGRKKIPTHRCNRFKEQQASFRMFSLTANKERNVRNYSNSMINLSTEDWESDTRSVLTSVFHLPVV